MRTTERKGFTLIELLIVVVIIGSLAAIAIPKFANTKEKAYIAAMKSDLRNLATAQENFFNEQDPAEYGDVAAGAAGLEFPAGSGEYMWSPSSGVEVLLVTGDDTGWDAEVERPGTDQTCTMWVGRIGAAHANSNEGEPTCE